MTDTAPYGYCPICGAPGVGREERPGGVDTCRSGHTYAGRLALPEPVRDGPIELRSGAMTAGPPREAQRIEYEHLAHTLRCLGDARHEGRPTSVFVRAADAIEAQAARIAELEAALAWYGEQAELARLIHSEGDAGRHAIQEDGGEKARAILASRETSDAPNMG